MGWGWENFEEHGQKSPNGLEQIVGRPLDADGSASKDLGASEEHGIESINKE